MLVLPNGLPLLTKTYFRYFIPIFGHIPPARVRFLHSWEACTYIFNFVCVHSPSRSLAFFLFLLSLTHAPFPFVSLHPLVCSHSLSFATLSCCQGRYIRQRAVTGWQKQARAWRQHLMCPFISLLMDTLCAMTFPFVVKSKGARTKARKIQENKRERRGTEEREHERKRDANTHTRTHTHTHAQLYPYN
jgi:hypothetical protein